MLQELQQKTEVDANPVAQLASLPLQNNGPAVRTVESHMPRDGPATVLQCAVPCSLAGLVGILMNAVSGSVI
jgi:hypothetical protein